MRSVPRRRLLLQLVAASWLCGMAGLAHGQGAAFPSRPVTIIVPATPGGVVDFVARQLAHELPKFIGQSVLVENKPGGGQVIGVQALLNAPADGHTIFIGSVGSNGTNYALYPKLPYAPSDMVGIAHAMSTPLVMVVHPSVPANTLKEFVALAKDKPGALSFASSGTGTSSQFAGESFKLVADIDMLHVPYKGASPALTDLLGGQVNVMFDQPVSSLPHIKSGKLRALAVTSSQRVPELSEVPTIAESGYPDFEMVSWIGVVASAKVPEPIVERLHTEIVKVLALPNVKRAIEDAGGYTLPLTTAQFNDFIDDEIERWGEVVRKANIKIE